MYAKYMMTPNCTQDVIQTLLREEVHVAPPLPTPQFPLFIPENRETLDWLKSEANQKLILLFYTGLKTLYYVNEQNVPELLLWPSSQSASST